MSIRNRTAYSFRSAIGDLKASHEKITSITGGFSIITDTSSAFGFTRWQGLCKKAGSRPVFGIELAVSSNIHAKKPTHDFWTFIAQDNLKALNELLLIATQQFRYLPLLSLEQAVKAAGVTKVIGYRTDFSQLDFSQPDMFVALAPSLAIGQYRRAKAMNAKFVAASDNRYLEPEDADLFAVSIGMFAEVHSFPQHLLDDAEWAVATRFAAAEDRVEALANRGRVLEASTAAQIQGSILIAAKPKGLRLMCTEGAQRLGCDLADPVYAARLERELTLIKEKDFEDYFYIIADLCQWARKKMIVGPARGSSCGSLVCYLLEITTIDPLKYGLIFERFIDINRSDVPDIDIDFSDTKRPLVFKYMMQKYGKEHVARLGTVSTFQPRSALQEAAGALDIPRWKIDLVIDALIQRSSGDSRALQATEDTLRGTPSGMKLLAEHPEILIATRMEGQPKHHSQHAAGVILTEQPVIEYVAVDARTGATHCDKKDAETLGLLKIDALGLTQLSVFEDCLEMANLPMNTLETVPLDDPAAFQVLNDKKYAGIFQFNGLALQSIANQIVTRELNDIVSVTALARPGPMNTGGTNTWIKVKTGRQPMAVPHPMFERQLKETLGVITYQEQVITICREVGGLNWADTTALRKAMSKSMGKEFFDQYGEKWKAGAIEKGLSKEASVKVWDDLCAYGSWAFNKSHAVAYGVISYYCCWLKAHYPVEFAAATMSHTDTPDTQIKLLREMAAEGIEYVAADLELSEDNWTVGIKEGKKVLVGPLSNVIGIGPKLMSQILSARKRNEPMPGRAEKLFAKPKTKIDSLYPITDRFKKLMPDPRERNILTPSTPIELVQTRGTEYDVLVFCTPEEIKPKDENEEINVAKRNGKRFDGPTAALNLRLSDDTGSIFAKVSRFEFEAIGRPILERGRPGKALYAIKGNVPPDFRMIRVRQVRYIGDLDEKLEEKTNDQAKEETAQENGTREAQAEVS